MFLLNGDWFVGELLELPPRCQGPFQGSKGKVGFLSSRRSGKGPHRALRGESPHFTRVAAENSGFLSSYDWDLSDPLVGPQESSVFMQVARGPYGFLCSRCQGQGPHLKLRPEPQCSSPVLTWISRFLWSFHRGVRPRLMCRHASLLSS